MKVEIAATAAGLALLLQPAQAASSDQAYRDELAKSAIQHCTSHNTNQNLLPGVRASMCDCYVSSFLRRLTAKEIETGGRKPGVKYWKVSALWKKSEAAFSACANGRQ